LGLAKCFYTKSGFLEYEKKFLLIPGCVDTSLEAEYLKGNLVKLKKPISGYYGELFNIISSKIEKKIPLAIIRASDGEAFFLQKKPVGNILRRHYTQGRDLENMDVEIFKKGLLGCDLRLIEMYRTNRFRFFKIFKKNVFSEIPFECSYALIASRKIFKTNWKIGIIGSEKKIEIIKLLFNSSEYREYIGRDGFEDYIAVPERGTANNPIGLANEIKLKLKKEIDLYLVGVGIAKMPILPILRDSSNNVFFDAGAGISALSGLVSKDRAYFAEWKNFRVKGYNYENTDIMDANMKEGKIVSV
jgi:hypothetical protein